MPVYDPLEQRMAIRVVYDGVACAGKTTNLAQLCTLFAAHRNLTLQSPAEMRGRTLYFDWMQISAGVVCGFPLLCQVLSVPGQVVLAPRRRHLLAEADVVVYVCESAPSSIATARAGLALYDEAVRARGAPIPLVVQANKQDRVGALRGSALLAALGREGAPIVEGIASEGIGVVDTFVTAIRTVVSSIQGDAERRSLVVPVRRAQTAAELFTEVSAAEIDPEWAAEMLLEEAEIALAVETSCAEASDGPAHAPVIAAARELASMTSGREPRGEPRPRGGDFASEGEVAMPMLPRADVPTGFIWPAHTGRAAVTKLALGDDARAAVDAMGRILYVTRDHVVKTATEARYADSESARQALVRRARELTQLHRLLVPETVLVAQTAHDGTCWIWTVQPELPSIEAIVRSSTKPIPDVLAAYSVGIVETLHAAVRNGFSIELSPSAFGLQNGAVRYIGDVVDEALDVSTTPNALFDAVTCVAKSPTEKTALLDIVHRELSRRSDERLRALLPSTLASS